MPTTHLRWLDLSDLDFLWMNRNSIRSYGTHASREKIRYVGWLFLWWCRLLDRPWEDWEGMMQQHREDTDVQTGISNWGLPERKLYISNAQDQTLIGTSYSVIDWIVCHRWGLLSQNPFNLVYATFMKS